MSVDQIRLQNFMAFADTDWIELRRLNLLLGRNSSGKSAVIRALRLMKQSLLTPESDCPLTFTLRGGVDIGSFDAMLHREPNPETEQLTEPDEKLKHWSDPVTFGFRGRMTAASLPPDSYARWPLLTQGINAGGADHLLFEIQLSYCQYTLSEQRVRLRKLEICWCQHEFPPVSLPSIALDLLEDRTDGTLLVAPISRAEAWLERLNHFLPSLNLSESLADPAVANSVGPLWSGVRTEIATFLTNIQYVGPVRPEPARSYILTDDDVQEWERRGWRFFLDYLLWPLEEERYEKLNQWLSTMRLGAKIEPRSLLAKPVGRLKGVFELSLDERGSDRDPGKRNLTDVGYGTSQIIPVIVAAITAPPDGLVLMEQPELHLHPEAQANIADLLIDSVNERITGIPDGHPGQPFDRAERGDRTRQIVEEERAKAPRVSRRFLVETHSETLFLRMRVELARTGAGIANDPSLRPEDANLDLCLKPEDLCGYYVAREPNRGTSEIRQLLFDERGEVKKRPDGFLQFFGQDNRELLELRKAQELGANGV
jgi:hypothetical protein